MIQPEDLSMGGDGARLDAGPINGGDAYIVHLARESDTTWVTGRFPQGNLAGTSRITFREGEDEPWLVEPVHPMYDEEEWGTWREALQHAVSLPSPV